MKMEMNGNLIWHLFIVTLKTSVHVRLLLTSLAYKKKEISYIYVYDHIFHMYCGSMYLYNRGLIHNEI